MSHNRLTPVELGIIARGVGTVLTLIILGVVGAGVAYTIVGDTHLWVIPLMAAFVAATGRMGWTVLRLVVNRLWP